MQSRVEHEKSLITWKPEGLLEHGQIFQFWLLLGTSQYEHAPPMIAIDMFLPMSNKVMEIKGIVEYFFLFFLQ